MKKVPNVQPAKKLNSMILMDELRVPYIVIISPNSNRQAFLNMIGHCLLDRHEEMPTFCLLLKALRAGSSEKALGDRPTLPNSLPKLKDTTNWL
ncbi:hypothetical protein ACKFKF_23405 [Phormidesmis sp. 146-12]